MDSQLVRARARAALPATLLVALSFAVRFPALLNARATNSDAAVVGLQAIHLLHGEWSPLLWGSTYQTSADGMVAALFFLVLGPTALALMLSALSLHALLTYFAYRVLRPHVRSPWTAFSATLPLVFTTACLHSYALYPPRQLSLTLAFAALAALDAAPRAKSPLRLFALGGLLAMFAWAADPYAMLLLPPLGVFALLSMPKEARARSLGALGAGAVVGSLPLVGLWLHPRAQHGVTHLQTSVLAHNWRLFAEDCCPWALGTKIYRPVHMMDYAPVEIPGALHAFQVGAVLLFFVLIFHSAWLVLRRSTEPGLARLFAFGFTALVVTVGSFQLSVMVMDHFSMRYLAAMLLGIPFLIAPALEHLRLRRGVGMLVPYLAVAGAAGWISHGPYVRGPWPVLCDAGRAADEAHLQEELAARGVTAATADYWSAYRLTFLFREAIPVVPLHETQDRYPPYRATYGGAKTVAYVFDELRSFEDRGKTLADLRADAALESVGAPVVAGPFTAYVFRRK